MKNYWLDNRRRAGFPSDDLNSLCQMSSGDANLDIWYNSQFQQNEWLEDDLSDHPCTTYTKPLQHLPVLPQSMTGTIYLDDKPIQTFAQCSSGIQFQEFAPSKVRVFYGQLIDDRLFLEWEGRTIEKYKVIVSYEYSLE